MRSAAKSIIGITLIEVLLVMAIAVMLIMMSVRYYYSVSASQASNALLLQLQAITEAADNLAQQSGSYTTANISNTTLQPLMQNGAKAFVTPWGTAITVNTPTTSTYRVTVARVPIRVCPLIINRLSTNRHFTNLSPTSAANCSKTAAADMTYTYSANL